MRRAEWWPVHDDSANPIVASPRDRFESLSREHPFVRGPQRVVGASLEEISRVGAIDRVGAHVACSFSRFTSSDSLRRVSSNGFFGSQAYPAAMAPADTTTNRPAIASAIQGAPPTASTSATISVLRTATPLRSAMLGPCNNRYFGRGEGHGRNATHGANPSFGETQLSLRGRPGRSRCRNSARAACHLCAVTRGHSCGEILDLPSRSRTRGLIGTPSAQGSRHDYAALPSSHAPWRRYRPRDRTPAALEQWQTRAPAALRWASPARSSTSYQQGMRFRRGLERAPTENSGHRSAF